MDRTLPFGFLDHKIKCGNALIGAWFDQFRHYPAMAWKNREGGDRNHANGVHFEQKARTQAIKAFVKERLTPDLKRFLRGADLFQPDLLEQAAAAHDEALAVLERMHAMPVHDAAERGRLYRDELVRSAAWRALKEAMDLWCACWFWPADEIEHAPLPSSFAEPPAETRAVAWRVAAETRFFHWELEFPDVFRETGSGFDALLGNPPCDIAKPVSKEFFSNLDPLYRSYGKQEALDRQTACFADAAVERDWLDYNARFRAQSNFTSHAASPFGDPEENAGSQDRFVVVRGRKNLEVHERWRQARTRAAGFGDPAHPFRHQGSADLNLYKLFLETAHALLKQPAPREDGARSGDGDWRGGRLGFVVPSGLYSDNGTGALRDLFLERCRWEWLFGVENRDKVFPIDSRFKFNPVVIEKGGATGAIRTAFMRRNLDDWERAGEFATSYTLAQIKQFSPKSRAILEIQSARDLEILEKIYANAVLLGDEGPDGWGIGYATEFHMTNDSHLFPPRPRWEAKGYRPDEYSRWLQGDWRPIEELWEEMGVDPSRPEPAENELEDWLFDTTAGPERREAEARFMHGRWMRPGDIARTPWRSRCARSPYDSLPIPRVAIPPSVVLSRKGDAWIREDVITGKALPLYEGRMIGLFDSSQKGWIRGKGRGAVWRDISWDGKQIEPQYLMDTDTYFSSKKSKTTPKIAYMRVSSSTNSRTTIASYLGLYPAGDSVFFFVPRSESLPLALTVSAVFATFAFDWVVRHRLSGLNMSEFVMLETAMPPKSGLSSPMLQALLTDVSTDGPSLARERLRLLQGLLDAGTLPISSVAPRRRAERIASINAAVAVSMGFSVPDLLHVFAECDYPRNDTSRKRPKGFWRVDDHLDPELRLTVLTLVAFSDLESKIRAVRGDRVRGLDAFLTQNDGEGWMLPETLRLADYDLGHDGRASEPQPVASRLGPRFYDWQLVQSADESRGECHLHARNLLGEHDYALRIVDLIERRMANGEDYLGLLTDRFTRDLLGNGGYVTALVEIRAREILYEGSYWATVTDLRNGGHLDDGSYNQLLDRLHARNLLDDVDHHRRRGRGMPAPAAGLPAQRAAEPRAGHQADLFPKKKQRDLFE